MRTEKQIEAARLNGARSRGPVTPEGKATSSRNATKHGITSQKLICLTNESAEQFLALLEGCRRQWSPQGDVENHLVYQIAANIWRTTRALGIETGLLDIEMDLSLAELDETFSQYDEGVRKAWAWNNLSRNSGALEHIQRYQARLQRSLQRLMTMLRDLQANRPPAQPSPDTQDTRDTQHIQENQENGKTNPSEAAASGPDAQMNDEAPAVVHAENGKTNPATAAGRSEVFAPYEAFSTPPPALRVMTERAMTAGVMTEHAMTVGETAPGGLPR